MLNRHASPRSFRTRSLGIRAGLLFLCLFLLRCAVQDVVVGAVLPLSGPGRGTGRSVERGLILAASALASRGGVDWRPLRLDIRDGGSRPAAGAETLDELFRSEAVAAAIGGTTTSEVNALIPVAEKYGKLLLSPCAAASGTPPESGAFLSAWPAPAAEGRALAEFAAYGLHASRALLIRSPDAYGEAVERAFLEAFRGEGRHADAVAPPADPGGFVPPRRRDAPVQVIVLAGQGAELTRLFQTAAAEAPDRLRILSGIPFPPESTYSKAPQSPPVLRLHPRLAPPDTERTAFAAAYRKRFGSEPDVIAARAYDLLMLLAEDMALAGNRPEVLRAGLEGRPRKNLVSGTFTLSSPAAENAPLDIRLAPSGKGFPVQPDDARLSDLRRRVEGIRFGDAHGAPAFPE